MIFFFTFSFSFPDTS